MKSKLLIIALFCVIFNTTKAQTFNPQLATMLQDTLTTYGSFISNIKGMSASVYIPGQGIWQGTYGTSYAGHPITSDMEFGIGSNSKLFVSTIMLKLAENGLINLNNPISMYLPTYTNVNPNITVRQLLNHKSGISDPIFFPPLMDTIMAHPTRVFTPTEVLSYLGAPISAPGVGWYYSNVNYILLGMIAQNITGHHISRLIRDNILTPLNMDSTFYDVEEPEFGTLAHRWWNNVDFHDTSRVALNTAAGAAGPLFSTASEMVQWYAALFGGQILNQNSITELTTFVSTGSNPAYKYGLGLAREVTQGLAYYAHGGDTWGYKTKMMHDTCLGTNVCVLANSYPAGIPSVAFMLYRVVKNHVPGCSAAISGLSSVCAGSNAITYTVPAIPNATSYIWTLPNGAIGTSITNTITVNYNSTATSGNITVTGTNNFGAGGSSSFYVNVKPIYMVNTAASICQGDTYTFLDGSTATTSTVHTSNMSTSAGCDSTVVTTLSVETVDATVSIGGASFMANATGTYQWLNCDNGNIPIPNATNQFFAPGDLGNYAVIVTTNGCSATSTCVNLFSVGINESNNFNSISIYPNPFTNCTTLISTVELHNASINIYNSLGQQVQHLSNLNGKTILLERNKLTAGIYLLHLLIENTNVSEKKLVIVE
jgi:D-alanyl-D-alanine carboxypeptidase